MRDCEAKCGGPGQQKTGAGCRQGADRDRFRKSDFLHLFRALLQILLRRSSIKFHPVKRLFILRDTARLCV
jgi:hypothetical protein